MRAMAFMLSDDAKGIVVVILSAGAFINLSLLGANIGGSR